jgi:hypothetical protein
MMSWGHCRAAQLELGMCLSSNHCGGSGGHNHQVHGHQYGDPQIWQLLLLVESYSIVWMSYSTLSFLDVNLACFLHWFVCLF